MSRRDDYHKYNTSPKGKLRHKRHKIDRPATAPGPAGRPGPIGAAAQRERRSRPEYVLAKKLGVAVSVAREMLT